ncbi:hypothetical protein GALL_520250 [mine drainage metagenome]|uniref:Uncharacterized protein n=1 Tax=mine drainage metagenome TaxID=410659 RepID=A0A1J5PFT3_9ZZZZ
MPRGARDLARNGVAVEVKECHIIQPADRRRAKHRSQRGAGDRPTAEPCDHRVNRCRGAAHRHAHVGCDHAAQPGRKAFFHADHALGSGQQIAQLHKRERPERADGDAADAVSRIAFGIDHILDRAVDRTQRDNHRFSPLDAVGPHQSTRRATKNLLKLGRKTRDHLQRVHLFLMAKIAHLGKRLGPDHRADGIGIVHVEHLHRIEGWQEHIHLFLRRHVDSLEGVGQDEAIHADHHRARQFLGNAEGEDVQVGGFLIGFRVKLNPTRILQRHRIRMIVPYVDRCANGAVAHRHHDRQTQPGRIVNRLCHEQEALTGRRRIGSRARR